MSVSTVTRHSITPAPCDPMFCHIQRTGPTSVIMRVVAKLSITLDHSGNILRMNFYGFSYLFCWVNAVYQVREFVVSVQRKSCPIARGLWILLLGK